METSFSFASAANMIEYNSMEYDIYFDESGDLGWKINEPYRREGSSRFFTIAYLILPKEDNKYINRFLKHFHKNRDGKIKEYKGLEFRNPRAKVQARLIKRLIDDHPLMTIGAVTAKKEHVPFRVTNSANKDVLYNHMVQLALCEKIRSLDIVNIIPDKRSIPAGSQNSCSDLLKFKLWLELNSDVEIRYTPEESHSNERLQFIDWVANFVWRRYENSQTESSHDAYQILRPILQEDCLFF